ncbi:TRAP transporter small permease [Desulfosediminicola flagellatus]|uniref:TRAP transporter small permease n=1 Tax=Desulfosediminicola flagellatus TaxID=2569541 RepID=UPI0010AD1549|nr:TRAP transporter small permease [Desulfosediminicola flagellatus]
MTAQPVRPTTVSWLSHAKRIEEYLLCLLLTTMILLACLQIGLRMFFDSGLLWADPMLRYLVLWSGLLGAAMATSRGKHIALDLAGFLTPKKLLPFVLLATHLFSCITAGFLTWAAYLFIRSEMEFSVPTIFDLPSWVINLIFPLAFALITLRYFILFITLAHRILRQTLRPQPDW